jgi:hypothetical protein
MLLYFPENTLAIVRVAYDQPYVDPIAVRKGETVVIDHSRSAETDILGWNWCSGPDGRQGWVPTAWLLHLENQVVVARDFSALELTVRPGERLTLHFSESGFVYVTAATGHHGWVPDACLELLESPFAQGPAGNDQGAA